MLPLSPLVGSVPSKLLASGGMDFGFGFWVGIEAGGRWACFLLEEAGGPLITFEFMYPEVACWLFFSSEFM
jgi:hypothetical protein